MKKLKNTVQAMGIYSALIGGIYLSEHQGIDGARYMAMTASWLIFLFVWLGIFVATDDQIEKLKKDGADYSFLVKPFRWSYFAFMIYSGWIVTGTFVIVTSIIWYSKLQSDKGGK